MEGLETTIPSNESSALHNLSKDQLLKKYEELLIAARKAKEHKDDLQKENSRLRLSNLETNKLRSELCEIKQNLSENTIIHFQAIKELKGCADIINNKLQQYIEDADNLIVIKNEEQKNCTCMHQTECLSKGDSNLKFNITKGFNELNVMGQEQKEHLFKLENCGECLKKSINKIEECLKINEVKDQDVDSLGKLKANLKLYEAKIRIFSEQLKMMRGHRDELLLIFKAYSAQVEDWKIELSTASKKLVEHINNINYKNSELSKENDILKSNNQELIANLKSQNASQDNSKDGTSRQEHTSLEKSKLSTSLQSLDIDISTSNISSGDSTEGMKNKESWEDRYGKLRILSLKLKKKNKDLSEELLSKQNENMNLQKTISDLENALEIYKKANQNVPDNVNVLSSDCSKHKALIQDLEKQITEFKTEKANVDVWKKQISSKVRCLRDELETTKASKNELENKIAELSAKAAPKERLGNIKSDDPNEQIKHSMDFAAEMKKSSVLHLEIKDYEKTINELSQSLEKNHEEILDLKNKNLNQETTIDALKDQNKKFQKHFEEIEEDRKAKKLEISALYKEIKDKDGIIEEKIASVENVMKLLENVRYENQELSIKLSKTTTENQIIIDGLKCNLDELKNQNLGLQHSLREQADTIKLKSHELETLKHEYNSYKVRAQSILKQNNSKDLGEEERLLEEMSTLKTKCDKLEGQLQDYLAVVNKFKLENEQLIENKKALAIVCEEASLERDKLKTLYEKLDSKYQNTITEHANIVESLKVNADNMAQRYRQQLLEQEAQHNREIMELQRKSQRPQSPIEVLLPQVDIPMQREDGEGSENTEINVAYDAQVLPLQMLLESNSEQIYGKQPRKESVETESRLVYLTTLLADTEQDLAKHIQMNKVLKEEIRRQQRSVEREKHADNLEYLKNVIFKFLTLSNGDERMRLIPVLNTIMNLSPEETAKLHHVVQGNQSGGRAWSNYLPLWSSGSPKT